MASDSGTDFSLWNPATGQAKEISLPNQYYRRISLLGFSWDHVEDDYKVVIVPDVLRCSSKHLYIYSCRSACWNRLILPASDGSKLHHRFNAAPSTIVKGLPYWNYIKYGRRNRMRYAYINVFAKDELRWLPLLYLNCSYLNYSAFNLVNIKDCHWWHSKCFKNGGEILMVNNDELCFYDRETLETKSIIRSNRGSFKNCCSYTPSLESVHGMESMTVLPFQEMEMKKLAIENSTNLVRSSSIPKSDSSSSTDTSSEYSETSESDSDAEKSSDSGTLNLM
ncbi:hypothetical protein POM88_023206 [Heracleum sosnowskyi]|uniref:F-box protein n=1 Tax=Heracleum sosnowskyi TaxID=360622 RepID=A0AAD8MUB1_9APIA|nr:hypothetical protein POM88_023206 [Heracleum sosnowskyi]